MKFIRFTIFFYCCICYTTFLNAQTRCVEVFHAKYGGPGRDEGQSVVYTRNGNVVVAGNSNSGGAGGTDGFIMKLNPAGNIEWSKLYGQAGDDTLYRIKQTPDDGFIAIGTSVTAMSPGGALWIMKTDANGTVSWNRKFSAGITDSLKGIEVLPLTAGGYAIAANINDSSAVADVLVMRLNNAGDIMWSKRFDEGNDEGVLAMTESSGELYISGYTSGDYRDAFLMRMNLANGNVSAARKFSATPGWHEEGASIEVHPGGINLTLKTYKPYGNLDEPNPEFSLIMMQLDAQWNITVSPVKSEIRPIRGNGRVTYARIIPVPGDGVLVGYHSDYIFSNGGTISHVDRTGRPAVNVGYNHQEGTMMDVDLMEDFGWVGTGRNLEGTDNVDIAVTKSDRTGKAGQSSCEAWPYGLWNTNNVLVANLNYTWSSIQSTPPLADAVLPAEQAGLFARNPGGCAATLCKPLRPAGSGAACTKGMFTQIADNLETSMFDGVRMDDGDILTLTYRFFHSSYIFPQLVKVKPDGTIRWAKHIVLDHSIGATKFAQRMLKLSDNTILVYGYGALMKIDQNGDVVWSKEVHYPFSGTYGFNSATEAENGDIILGIANGLMRIDGAAGSVVWENAIDFQGLNPFYRGLICENGSVFLALEYVRQHPNGYLAVARFNAATGGLDWVRQFSVPGKELDAFHLKKSGNELTLGIGLYSEISLFNWDYRVGAVRLNSETGAQLGGWKLADKQLVRPYSHQFIGETVPAHMDSAPGDSLIFAHETYQGRDTAISIMKFSKDGKLAWSRKYINLKSHGITSARADGEGILLTGNYFPLKYHESTKEGIIMRTDRNGVIEGATAGNCYSVEETGTIVSLTLQEDVPTLLGASPISVGNIVPATVYTDPVPAVFAVPSCDVPTTCGSISITGPDKICDLSQTYTYRANKASGCLEPVSWSADPTMADIISQSDGELIIKFKKEGATRITGSIDAGCRIISGFVNAEVVKSATTAVLGADRIICEGNTVVLDPGDGFASYLWHDGSITRKLTATAPGDYSVTVTDKCGNTFVEEITLLPQPDYAFSLGPDIRKCVEASVIVDIPQGFNNYTWNTDFNKTLQGNQATLFPDQDTVYILTAEKDPGCFVRDTVRVTMILPEKITLGADINLCAGDSLLLQAPSRFNNVVWSTGNSEHSFYAKAAGRYTVQAIDPQGCATYDTLIIGAILPVPVVGLPQDGILCEGGSKTLQAGSGVSWNWSTGAQTNAITVNQPGKWWVTVTGANGCVAADTVEIARFTNLPAGFLPGDMEICRQASYTLQSLGNFSSYRWSTGDQSPAIPVRQPGTYWLEVTDFNGCRGREEVTVTMKDCITAVWFPNVFTPNRDGRHDLFRPVVKGVLTYYHLRIFHRWGNLVFESRDPAKGWNGLVQEQPATAGAYVWMCEYQLAGEERKQENGTLLLMR